MTVTSDDVGCVIALNLKCGSFPFTLGKVTAVTDAVVTFDVCLNLQGDLDGTWTLSRNLKRTYSKDVVIRKRIAFTKEVF